MQVKYHSIVVFVYVFSPAHALLANAREWSRQVFHLTEHGYSYVIVLMEIKTCSWIFLIFF